MFREWLAAHHLSNIDLSHTMFPTADDRAFWEQVDGEVFIKRAEELIDFDWPTILATDFMAFSRVGDRNIMENKHFARRRAFNAFVLAEVCEGKGRFTDQIINGIMAISEESFWGVSAHYIKDIRMIPDACDPYIDLFAGETGSAVAVCRHLLGNQLSEVVPEIVERMDYELNRRIIQPFLTHEDFWWMGYNGRHVNNWNPWVLSNITTVALLCVHDNETRTKVLEKALYLLDNYMNSVPADGGCDEGMVYWNVSAGAVFDLLYQLYLASDGQIDFFTDPLIYKMGDYACKAYIGKGRVVNLADGANRLSLPGFSHGVIYNFGKMTNNERLMGLGYIFRGLTGREQDLRRTLTAMVYPPEEKPFEPYRESVLEDLEVSFVRSKHFFGAIKGGHNGENHNHNDVGSFLIFTSDSEPVFIDAGVGVYTKETFSENRYRIWSMQSSWHNLPDLNGVAQRDGTSFRSAAFSYENGVTHVDFAPAYPADAGVTSAARTFSVGDDEIQITDVFAFTGDTNTIDEHFLLIPKPVVIGNGEIAIGDFLFTYDDTLLDVTIEEKNISYDARLYDSWRQDSVWRLTLSAKVAATATFEFTLKRR